ncbi:hypothetical protein AXF42_Ash004163 [Apostasia shenzhenica]|uniref:Protein MIZU-KUSSEI 1 n=1 Tax=Apostasia shenzhenica TaxID=1088818 RepID=A0A2I0A241_9ASPA|nr:hypothetical protein AXF42_Ash004163 [Apostasia shenzhenica]
MMNRSVGNDADKEEPQPAAATEHGVRKEDNGVEEAGEASVGLNGNFWNLLLWAVETMVAPCNPVFFLRKQLQGQPPPPTFPITGTIICPLIAAKESVSLCFQSGGPSSGPLLLLKLPIPLPDLIAGEDCHVTLQCHSSAGVPLLTEQTWAVSCNGRRRPGFASRVEESTAEASRVLLGMIENVSAGVGLLPAAGGGGGLGRTWFMRARFERVVGSADSESFYLVDPTQSFGFALSVFFLRC